MAENVYWIDDVPEYDDFGHKIKDQFIDGKTKRGSWAFMTPDAFIIHGCGKLGVGYGQLYKKTTDGWLKIEG